MNRKVNNRRTRRSKKSR